MIPAQVLSCVLNCFGCHTHFTPGVLICNTNSFRRDCELMCRCLVLNKLLTHAAFLVRMLSRRLCPCGRRQRQPLHRRQQPREVKTRAKLRTGKAGGAKVFVLRMVSHIVGPSLAQGAKTAGYRAASECFQRDTEYALQTRCHAMTQENWMVCPSNQQRHTLHCPGNDTSNEVRGDVRADTGTNKARNG